MVLHERNIQIQEVIVESFYLLLRRKCCERVFRPNVKPISFCLKFASNNQAKEFQIKIKVNCSHDYTLYHKQ